MTKETSDYPLATIIHYGPDAKTTVKIAVSIIPAEDQDPQALKRWIASSITHDKKIKAEILAFIRQHAPKTVIISKGNMGCVHEEGIDFSQGSDCPFCSYWKGKQGSRAKPREIEGIVLKLDDFTKGHR